MKIHDVLIGFYEKRCWAKTRIMGMTGTTHKDFDAIINLLLKKGFLMVDKTCDKGVDKYYPTMKGFEFAMNMQNLHMDIYEK